MKFFYFLIITSLLSFGVLAQQGTPFSWSLNYLPTNKESESKLLQTQLSLNAPVFNDSSFTGLIGTSFKYYGFRFKNDSLNIYHLYSWSIPFTFQIKTSDSRYVTFMLEPMLSSGFKSIRASDFRYNLALLFIKRKLLKSTGFGIAVSKRFSGFQLAPMWVANFRVGQHWIFTGTIPFKSKIAYEIDSKKQLGINFGANTNSFRLYENGEGYYLDYQTIEASLFYQHTILKNVKLHLGFGAQSLQSKVYNNRQTSPLGIFLIYPNNTHEPIETYTNKGMILVQLGVSYAIQ
ncbi:MAG TPA: hypothetical protein DCQ26_03750 [Marinilabiliales bacterium]|jgi:hypothetical protein|nr:MAG: hypothetical protein A2W95_12370 [Bacteroidetes bacterium GWA2_40_14]OFX58992.1 MAG: hypothetical protein A2W84_00100 [Bacteroidetes bacterium GWC2_40_13]OFX71376.1 MAG: hypothetical protein A2W96_14560 [Bacteroidetes bacterium GWD2_40_43]OFX91429.1 MAG: hypothetical protein A2W97_04295 [Bacteroidetes bacterium GWE2_40_63]OFY19498.1 MAG: hypothetical protein A2W88_02175 [Bacteroidetes bacterium GWF2_40_13]OFZ25648.1 MAG: hypothetical protein A2437_12580 [Bacteroidetes bacterium RIFOXYC